MAEDHQPDAPPREAPELVTDDIIASVAAGEPHVVVRTLAGVHRVDVFDRDRLGLFADTAGLLAASGLVVRTAILRTYEGDRGRRVAGGVTRAATRRTPPRSPAACAVSPTATARRCSPWSGAGRPAVRRARSPPSGSPGQTRAMVVPHASEDATVIEVRAVDRVGLLHEIGMTFARAGLERPQRPHRHLRGADARHVLRHRVRRPEPAAGPGGAGRVHAHRRVRRSAVAGKIALDRVHQPL